MTPTTRSPREAGLLTLAAEVYKCFHDFRFVLSLSTLPLSTAALTLLHRVFEGPIEVGRVFALTWPLSLSVAIAGVKIVRDRERDWWGTLVLFSFLLGVTSWIGARWHFAGAVAPFDEWWKLPLWPIFVIVSPGALGRLLDAYVRLYGSLLFFSSVAVGVFLAWLWGAKILPRFDAEVPVSQIDKDKLAAALRDLEAKRKDPAGPAP